MKQFGSLTNSASVFSSTKPQSPTYQGYAHFSKLASPSLSSEFVKPPHMCSPEYLAVHAFKPDTDSKTIALNNLEEGVKLSILSDIERDQRLLMAKENIEKTFVQHIETEKKRKQDHIAFDEFVKTSRLEKAEMEQKFAAKFSRSSRI